MKCEHCNKDVKLINIIHYKHGMKKNWCDKCVLGYIRLSDYVPCMYWGEKNTVHYYTDLKQPK